MTTRTVASSHVQTGTSLTWRGWQDQRVGANIFSWPEDEDDLVIQASSEFGSLFVDGLGDHLRWHLCVAVVVLSRMVLKALSACLVHLRDGETPIAHCRAALVPSDLLLAKTAMTEATMMKQMQ